MRDSFDNANPTYAASSEWHRFSLSNCTLSNVYSGVDEDISDANVNKLIIVTQTPPPPTKRQFDRTGDFCSRAKLNKELNTELEIGLRRYESDLWSRREQLDHQQDKLAKVGTISEEEFKALKDAAASEHHGGASAIANKSESTGKRQNAPPPAPPSSSSSSAITDSDSMIEQQQSNVGDQSSTKTSVWAQKAKERAALPEVICTYTYRIRVCI